MKLNIWIKIISIYLLFEVIIDMVSYGINGMIVALILKSTSAYGIVVLIDKIIQHRQKEKIS